MVHNQRVNFLAVSICVIICMVLPAFWYGLLSEPWMEANNLTLEEINQSSNTSPYIIAFIANLITMYVLAWLFIKLDVESVIRGALTALLIGIAFNFVVVYTQNIFSMRPSILNFIDGGITLINWTISGAILGFWTKYKPE